MTVSPDDVEEMKANEEAVKDSLKSALRPRAETISGRERGAVLALPE